MNDELDKAHNEFIELQDKCAKLSYCSKPNLELLQITGKKRDEA